MPNSLIFILNFGELLLACQSFFLFNPKIYVQIFAFLSSDNQHCGWNYVLVRQIQSYQKKLSHTRKNTSHDGGVGKCFCDSVFDVLHQTQKPKKVILRADLLNFMWLVHLAFVCLGRQVACLPAF